MNSNKTDPWARLERSKQREARIHTDQPSVLLYDSEKALDERRYVTRSSKYVRQLFHKESGEVIYDEKPFDCDFRYGTSRNFAAYRNSRKIETYPGMLELQTDAFNAFFRGGYSNPKLTNIRKQKGEFFPEFYQNQKFLQEFFMMPMVKKVLETTRGNVPASITCLLYTSPSPRDRQKSRMPSSA